MVIVAIVYSLWRKHSIKTVFESISGTYKLFIKLYDNAPHVHKIVICTDEIPLKKIEPSLFTVTLKTSLNEYSPLVSLKRRVTDSYICDADGKREESAFFINRDRASHIALELEVESRESENYELAKPFLYNEQNRNNEWKERYYFSIEHPDLQEALEGCDDMFYPEDNETMQFMQSFMKEC